MNCTKIILSLTFLLSTFLWQNSNAQEEKKPPVSLTKAEGLGFSYEKIIDLPAVTKEQAYDRVKQWVVTNLKTGDNNIAFDDKGKENINTSSSIILDKRSHWFNAPIVGYKISFSFKDGKMKISASQFAINMDGRILPFDNFGLSKKDTEFIYESFDAKFTALITSVQAAASKDKSNW